VLLPHVATVGAFAPSTIYDQRGEAGYLVER
jgi:hypothetical protein